MDNLTHALIGYGLARAVPGRSALTARQRLALSWTGIISSNLGDLDFAVGLLDSEPKLAYLLHHRGHTHTLVAAPGLALLAVLLVCAALRVRPGRALATRMTALAVVGALLHVGFDAFNNYGVHPFYPWDNRWYYGDWIFIIEPLLSFSLLPLVLVHAEAKVGRWLALLLTVALLAALLLVPHLPWQGGALAALWLTAWGGWQWRLRAASTARITLPAAVGVGLTLLSFGLGRAAAREAVTLSLARATDQQLVDLVSTPLPANPLCWAALAVTVGEGDRYAGHHAGVSLAPTLLPPDRCSLDHGQATTAELTDAGLEAASELSWARSYRGDLAQLRAIASSGCRARALLRFARVPFWSPQDAPAVLGDLRFDRRVALDFAEIELTPTRAAPCPRWDPPWVPPSAALSSE